jgi:hypothetical protein
MCPSGACYVARVAKVSPTTRWDLVALAQRDELRYMTDEEKLAQVASLMASVTAMGWDEALQQGDETIWMRWQAIRTRALRVPRSARRK